MEDDLIWYANISGAKTIGPLSVRDLEVLLRTGELEAKTLLWREGQKNWLPFSELAELSHVIEELDNAKRVHDKADSEQLQNQQLQKEDETILEMTVQNLLKNSFRKGEDGLWNIYDQGLKAWTVQNEQPVEQIAKMKKTLLATLRARLATKGKGRGRADKGKGKGKVKSKVKSKNSSSKNKKKLKWYEAKLNTYIYVRGLPPTVEHSECKAFFGRAGLIRLDRATAKEKIKLYRNEDGQLKGDGVVSYLRPESVEIALEILNGQQIAPGFPVTIERASFTQKSEQYIPRETPSREVVKAAGVSTRLQKEELGWKLEEERAQQKFRVVVLKHMFTREQVQQVQEWSELQEDIEAELARIGRVREIKYYENSREGVVRISFEKEESAGECLSVMQGRYFDGRVVEADFWDGRTDFNLRESAEEEERRAEQFGAWLQK